MRVRWPRWTGRGAVPLAPPAAGRRRRRAVRPRQPASHDRGLVRDLRAPQPRGSRGAHDQRLRGLPLTADGRGYAGQVPSPDVNELTSRVARAQSLMREAGVDVLLLSPGADLRYLSG